VTVTLSSIDTTVLVKTGNIVMDYTTGLQWQDDATAATYRPGNWTMAGAYCTAMTLDGVSGWRLPTLTELQGIVDTGNSPAIKTGFTNTVSQLYWSSTEVDATYAWYVYFYDGSSVWTLRALTFRSLCEVVRR